MVAPPKTDVCYTLRLSNHFFFQRRSLTEKKASIPNVSVAKCRTVKQKNKKTNIEVGQVQNCSEKTQNDKFSATLNDCV